MKIAVGMSGGVDSSVAALLLKQQGHEVIGLTMRIWSGGSGSIAHKGNACYGPEEAEDIALIKDFCANLAIPFHVIDCSAYYEQIVLENFRQEYRSGRTPNPCIRCNQEVKFGYLPRRAKESGLLFDRFATGHYARTAFDPSRRRYILRKGVEQGKDQSYFLYRLSQEQLASVVFPVGDLRKDEVRRACRYMTKKKARIFTAGITAISSDRKTGREISSTGQERL
jgi:tRNA-uridine 2-sulfurtransferase